MRGGGAKIQVETLNPWLNLVLLSLGRLPFRRYHRPDYQQPIKFWTFLPSPFSHLVLPCSNFSVAIRQLVNCWMETRTTSSAITRGTVSSVYFGRRSLVKFQLQVYPSNTRPDRSSIWMSKSGPKRVWYVLSIYLVLNCRIQQLSIAAWCYTEDYTEVQNKPGSQVLSTWNVAYFIFIDQLGIREFREISERFYNPHASACDSR